MLLHCIHALLYFIVLLLAVCLYALALLLEILAQALLAGLFLLCANDDTAWTATDAPFKSLLKPRRHAELGSSLVLPTRYVLCLTIALRRGLTFLILYSSSRGTASFAFSL